MPGRPLSTRLTVASETPTYFATSASLRVTAASIVHEHASHLHGWAPPGGGTGTCMATDAPAPSDAPTSADRPDETPAERADRNFVELLQELRVAQTGVQILFAFLLTLPFTNRFVSIDGFQRGVYVFTLVSSATTVALLVAPVAVHRLLFQRGRKRELVYVGH